VPPGSDFKSAVDHDIDIAVSSIKALDEVGAVAGAKRPRIHLEVDTGMTRGGFLSEWNEIDAHHVKALKLLESFLTLRALMNQVSHKTSNS
jgi:alanine racemase